jgi:hypothetical protein
MKAYFITTGILFGLLALAHFARTIAESTRLLADPWFILEGPGIGVARPRSASGPGDCLRSAAEARDRHSASR